MAANIDRAPNSEAMLAVLPPANLFIGEAQSDCEKKPKRKSFQDTPHPTTHWRAHGGLLRFLLTEIVVVCTFAQTNRAARKESCLKLAPMLGEARLWMEHTLAIGSSAPKFDRYCRNFNPSSTNPQISSAKVSSSLSWRIRKRM